MNSHKFIAQNINYSIGKKTIIENISINISNEEITGFLGPNGAGKTTFFHILAGLIQPSTGTITLNEKNISNLPTHKRLKSGIAFLPQNSSIFQQLSVKDNILSGLDFNKFITKSEKIERLNELLHQFNLHNIQNTLGINLSGGERRKVELARCLIMSPKFILLDEPFAGIDPVTIKETQQMLKKIKSTGTGILISDHNATDTLKICKTIYLIYKGKVLIQETPKNIAKNELAKTHYFGQSETD
jgi:lipopolysaccharide export system ATP-binding protein